MRTGNLRTLVTIQEQQLGQDHFDSLVRPPWKNVTEAWWGLEPLSGQELMIAQQQQHQTTHNVEMHYQPGIKSAMRAVSDEGRVFQIESVVDVGEMHRELKLKVIERELPDKERAEAIQSLKQ